MPTPMPDSACPRCRTALVTHLSEVPWCPACLWNIDAFEPGDKKGPLRRLYRRLAFRAAFGTFRALQTGDDPARGATAVALGLVSLVIGALLLAMLALGVRLSTADFPAPTLLPGVPLILFALWLRPRFGKTDPHATVLTRPVSPALFALIDRVAAALDTRAPHRVEFVEDAVSAGYVAGIGRRRVLRIGATGWLMYTPQERVAILAWCLASLRDGHAADAMASQLALRTFGRVSDMFLAPPNPRWNHWCRGNTRMALIERLVAVLMLPVSALCWGAELAVWRLAVPGFQRDHYRDDRAASAVAGGEAMRTLLDKHLLTAELHTVASAMARRGEFAAPGLIAAAGEVMDRRAGDLPALRQATIRRDTALSDGAPALGFRIALLGDLAPAGAAVVSSRAESEAVDAELAPHIKRLRGKVASDWYN
ncbi:hypothetical protein Afil01_41880 [Actinorhabdospora filicis]|uniref:Peptidase M48 domain-containing protein n=1 Tax=Actinorhabdospora filicis TaxID=1785913 RepID=A0A9W6SNU2_9ACTN|nr:M48 family metallopeptidase [Actinorhabdospora filicis]GLZ79381.1 hypothetical protein Afil01_41880 [Actinorhabdospora filicis]